MQKREVVFYENTVVCTSDLIVCKIHTPLSICLSCIQAVRNSSMSSWASKLPRLSSSFRADSPTWMVQCYWLIMDTMASVGTLSELSSHISLYRMFSGHRVSAISQRMLILRSWSTSRKLLKVGSLCKVIQLASFFLPVSSF